MLRRSVLLDRTGFMEKSGMIAPTCSQVIRRRGIAALALVILLAVVSLAIVGMVMGGARDMDLMVSRLETVRALYAAEGGAELAMRELMTSTDIDGDGAMGSISDDGNSANNPSIGGASVWVDRTPITGGATFDIKGSTSVARRAWQINVLQVPPSTVIYSANPSHTPLTRDWSGTSWSAASSTLDIGAKPRWINVASCPTRSEAAFIASDDQRDINVMILNGSTWGDLLQVSTDMGTNSDRPLAIAYEQLSGDAIAVYRIGNSATIYFRTWNGTAWSSQQSTANLSSGELRFLHLASKPGTDRILLAALDDNKDLVGMVWDGSAWGSKVVLDTSAKTSSEECVDIAFETLSGDALVMWSRDGQDTPHYRTYTSGGWSSDITGPDIGDDARWIRLASDPSSDTILMLALDDGKDVNAATWSGTVFSTAQEFETDANVDNRRGIAVAFESAGTRAIAAYTDGTLHSPRYRVYDGANWSSELTGPDLGDDLAAFQMAPLGTGQEILTLVVTRGEDRLKFMRWNGTSFVSAAELEDNLAGTDSHESFMIIPRTGGEATVTGITAVEP